MKTIPLIQKAINFRKATDEQILTAFRQATMMDGVLSENFARELALILEE
jgi:hypothetical protein